MLKEKHLNFNLTVFKPRNITGFCGITLVREEESRCKWDVVAHRITSS